MFGLATGRVHYVVQVRICRSDSHIKIDNLYGRVTQLYNCTVQALLCKTQRNRMGKNEDYFQVIWRRMVGIMLRSNGNVYW